MIDNHYYCGLCIEFYNSARSIQMLVDTFNLSTRIDEKLNNMRRSLNFASLLNNGVVFLIYGGPKLITIVSLSSSILSFVSLFVTNSEYALYLDLSVVVVCFTVLIKSIHALTLRMFVNQQDENKKRL